MSTSAHLWGQKTLRVGCHVNVDKVCHEHQMFNQSSHKHKSTRVSIRFRVRTQICTEFARKSSNFCIDFRAPAHLHHVVCINSSTKSHHKPWSHVHMSHALVWCGVVWCGLVWCGVVWRRRRRRRRSACRGPTDDGPWRRPPGVPHKPAEGVLRLTSARARRISSHT